MVKNIYFMIIRQHSERPHYERLGRHLTERKAIASLAEEINLFISLSSYAVMCDYKKVE